MSMKTFLGTRVLSCFMKSIFPMMSVYVVGYALAGENGSEQWEVDCQEKCFILSSKEIDILAPMAFLINSHYTPWNQVCCHNKAE